ncbi:MAG: aminotransferase class I/II-fold pyridoxal phosphate-dependent enzyme [Zavarzinella sp.]
MNFQTAFAKGLTTETAFDVLAIAKKLKAAGKDVIELQIGDSPFPSSRSALRSGHQAIDDGLTRYCPSPGLPAFREAIAQKVQAEFGIPATPENVVVGPGAKVFEQFFCELFVEPGDEVLLFSPAFPTFEPNIRRRGGIPVFAPLSQENAFRPDLGAIESFIQSPKAKAIFLNSPHNPTGGVATEDDLVQIANLIRGKPIALLSDEPYCHMAWESRHHSILAQPDMLSQCVGAYTFSKSYSMSGWRVGFAISSPENVTMISKMINTSLSCVPPINQTAAMNALIHDDAERDETMQKFRTKVELLVRELQNVPGVHVLMPAGTFYVFPKVQEICEKLHISSHGLAMYLLQGADDHRGVACLGGECFGAAGNGFLRFSCAEPDERIVEAVHFFAAAITRTERVADFLQQYPHYQR